MKPVLLIEAPEKLSAAERDRLYKYVSGVLDEHGIELPILILDGGITGKILLEVVNEDDEWTG